jgi:DNA-binding IclR family transcriptional regulator
MPNSPAAPRGTQTVSRAVTLLKAVAARPQQGWRLTDLAGYCGADKGSAHRMLAGLVRERLVLLRTADKHYLPGPLLFELGLAVPQMNVFRAACSAALTRLATHARGAAFLYLHSGDEFVCAARTGLATLKGLSIDEGTRRPLIVSAGGVAILLALPPAEQKRIEKINFGQIASFGAARASAVRTMLRRSRSYQFGVNLSDVVPGIDAFGMALRDAQARVVGSISVAMPSQPAPRARLQAMEALLRNEAMRIEKENASAVPLM